MPDHVISVVRSRRGIRDTEQVAVKHVTTRRLLRKCRLEYEATGVKLCKAFRDVCNRRETHDASCVEARKALQRTNEKRQASEVIVLARGDGADGGLATATSSGLPRSEPPSEHSEVILVERQR